MSQHRGIIPSKDIVIQLIDQVKGHTREYDESQLDDLLCWCKRHLTDESAEAEDERLLARIERAVAILEDDEDDGSP